MKRFPLILLTFIAFLVCSAIDRPALAEKSKLAKLFSTPQWEEVNGTYKSEIWKLEADFPQGWLWDQKDGFVYTCEGTLLQMVRFGKYPIDKDVPPSKKQFKKDMLPQEAVELMIELRKMRYDATDFKLLEISPASISGIAGCKAVYTMRSVNEPKLKAVTYGFCIDEDCYDLSYVAPFRYYFDKHAAEFEKIISTFKLIKP